MYCQGNIKPDIDIIVEFIPLKPLAQSDLHADLFVKLILANQIQLPPSTRVSDPPYGFKYSAQLSVSYPSIEPPRADNIHFKRAHFHSCNHHLTTMASGFATTGTVTFSRGSTEFDLDLNWQSPITTEQLGYMFHVRPDTIWLVSQFDNRGLLSAGRCI